VNLWQQREYHLFPGQCGEGFNTVIDLLQMKALVFAADKSGKFEVREIRRI
jgi:hypothetical protein